MDIPRIRFEPPRRDDEKQPDDGSVWLWPELATTENIEQDACPWLDPYLLPGPGVRGAVIVFPGGGYVGRAPYEGGPVAEMFNDAGFHAFVLNYRVQPHRHPRPLMDAARAVRTVRSRAAEWHVAPERVAVCGFSAGGHLAGSLCVFYAETAGDHDDLSVYSARPNAAVLCYPVISSGKLGHRGSFDNLVGPEGTEGERTALSLEKQVHKDVPPAFLWTTQEDEGVPAENSMMYAQALRNYNIPFELHVYPKGPHGMGLAQDDPHLGTWTSLACGWLKMMGI